MNGAYDRSSTSRRPSYDRFLSSNDGPDQSTHALLDARLIAQDHNVFTSYFRFPTSIEAHRDLESAFAGATFQACLDNCRLRDDRNNA